MRGRQQAGGHRGGTLEGLRASEEAVGPRKSSGSQENWGLEEGW